MVHNHCRKPFNNNTPLFFNFNTFKVFTNYFVMTYPNLVLQNCILTIQRNI